MMKEKQMALSWAHYLVMRKAPLDSEIYGCVHQMSRNVCNAYQIHEQYLTRLGAGDSEGGTEGFCDKLGVIDGVLHKQKYVSATSSSTATYKTEQILQMSDP